MIIIRSQFFIFDVSQVALENWYHGTLSLAKWLSVVPQLSTTTRTLIYLHPMNYMTICLYVYMSMYIYISTCITKPIARLLNHQLTLQWSNMAEISGRVPRDGEIGATPMSDSEIQWRSAFCGLLIFGEWISEISEKNPPVSLGCILAVSRDMQVEITDNVISCQRAPN